MYGGTKSPVSVSDEKVQANQDRVYFKHLYLFLTSDIYYLWNGIGFESVILLKFIHFYKKFISLKNERVKFLGNESDLAILISCFYSMLMPITAIYL